MLKEPPVASVGQDCCILNSIETVHNSLTVVRALTIPDTSFWQICNCVKGMDAAKINALITSGIESFEIFSDLT
jgi:hypothetical protein